MVMTLMEFFFPQKETDKEIFNRKFFTYYKISGAYR